jgi:electron transfer flavoprotein beta subunit
MKIVVCVKNAGRLGDEIVFGADGRVDPFLLEFGINEWDVYATEEALRLRESEGGEVVVVTRGDEEAEDALRRCLAMGVDRAARITGDDDADPLVVARDLAQVIAAEQPDLVLCGVQSSDAAQGATGGMLAELLGLPLATVVRRVEVSGGALVVERELEGGLGDLVEVDLPALLTVQTGINEPRYAPLRAIRKAQEEEIALHTASGGPRAYVVRQLSIPSRPEGATPLDGDAARIAEQIVEIVKGNL